MNNKNGTKLYEIAKTIIPGGTTLFSKRSELHLPNKWPAYFERSKNINLWDTKGVKYLDMFCAVGTSILGYNNLNVNRSVINAISKGNMTSLNCPEEIMLAQKLIKHHTWASMAKFTRGGGEANAVAIRIARSCTKKKKCSILWLSWLA